MFAYHARPRILLSAAFVVFLLSSLSKGQTRQYLDAPVVKSNIRVRWNPTAKAMEWAADGSGTFRGLQSDTLFLTKRSVFVTYPLLNPLRVQANASATAVADPAFATITKLIESLMGVANTVAPALPNPPIPAGAIAPAAVTIACGDAVADLRVLRTTCMDRPLRRWLWASPLPTGSTPSTRPLTQGRLDPPRLLQVLGR